MAIRISSDASAPKRSANSPAQTSYTLAGWFKYNSIRAAFQGPLSIYAGADGAPTTSTQYQALGAPSSGSSTLSLLYTNGAGVSQSTSLITLVVDQWFFCAMAGTATTIGGLRGYARPFYSPILVAGSNAVAGLAFTAARFEYGRDGFTGEFIDGAAQHCVAFDRALDGAELLKLSYALLLRKRLPDTRNLNVYYKFSGSHDIQDWSGNTRPSTMTVGVNAQGYNLWTRDHSPAPAASSTTTPKTVTGSLSFAGALQKQVNKNLTGALSFAGGLQKRTNKNLAGVLSFSGGLLAQTVRLLSISGALSFAGNLQKQTNKVLSGSLSFAGALQKQTNKILSGTLSFVGAISLKLTLQKILSGVLSFAGGLVTLFTPGGGGVARWFHKRRSKRDLRF